MRRIRDAIKNECFPEFVRKFMQNYFYNLNKENKQVNLEKETEDAEKKERNSVTTENSCLNNKFNIPDWVVNALKEVNIDVLDPIN